MRAEESISNGFSGILDEQPRRRYEGKLSHVGLFEGFHYLTWAFFISYLNFDIVFLPYQEIPRR